MYVRRSPKKARAIDALSQVYYLRDLLENRRLEIRAVLVRAEEYRYSERMRYRKKGAYDCDLYPVELVEEISLCGVDDYMRFIPDELRGMEFDAKQYATVTKLHGRALYSALNTLYAAGLLSRRGEGKKYVYSLKSNYKFQ